MNRDHHILHPLNRIAYHQGKRFRVVTLDGQLIETSGTMAGGGAAKQRGAMRGAKVGSAAGAHSASDG